MSDAVPIGLSDLATKLISSRCTVLAHEHSAAWIDVNAVSDVRNAEQLVSIHQRDFDLWASKPEIEARSLIVRDGKALLESLPGAPDLWTLPADSEIDRSSEARTARAHDARPREPDRTQPLIEFDDIAGPKYRPIRIQVFAWPSDRSTRTDPPCREWWDLSEATHSERVDRTAARALSVWLQRNRTGARA
jgi:hypothetical protein